MTTLPYMDRRVRHAPLLPYKVKVLDDLMGGGVKRGVKGRPMGVIGSWPLYRRGLGGGEVVGRGGFRGGLGRANNSKIASNLPHPTTTHFINRAPFTSLTYSP